VLFQATYLASSNETGARAKCEAESIGGSGKSATGTHIDENGFVGSCHSEEDLRSLLVGSTSALMRIATAFLGNLKSPEASESLGSKFVALYGKPPTIH
jgi:hypothetical protein